MVELDAPITSAETALLRSEVERRSRTPTPVYSSTLDQEEKNTQHPPWKGFEVTSSACVRSVQDGGPAAECGIAVGDNIKKVGEWAVSTLDDIRRIVKDHVCPGQTVSFTLQRETGASIQEIVVYVLVRCVSMKLKESESVALSPRRSRSNAMKY